jgi:hypothetical protein
MPGITKDSIAKTLGVKSAEPNQDDTKQPAPTDDTKPVKEEPVAQNTPALPKDYNDIDLSKVMDAAPAPAEPAKQDDGAHQQQKDARAYAAMRKQIQELETELNLLKAQPHEDPEEVKTLREQLTAKETETNKLLDQIAAMDLERDPRFRARYESAETTMVEQIKEVAKDLEVDEEVITQALSMPLRKRVELLTEEVPHAAPTLLTLFAQRDALQKKKEIELRNHAETRQMLDKERGVQELALEHQARERLFQGALAEAQSTGNFVFQELPGNEARNELVKKVIGSAQNLFNSNDGERQAKAMLLGVAAPIYLHMLHMERTARLKLEGELARRFGKTPSVTGSTSASQSKDGKPEAMDSETAAKMLTQKLFSQNT